MKNKLVTLLYVLSLSALLVNTGKTEVYAAEQEEVSVIENVYVDGEAHVIEKIYINEQIKVNLDLDGGTLKNDYNLKLTHKETEGREGAGGWIIDADYFTVKQVRELGEPEKEGYTFIGWHGSSEVYTHIGDYTPIEIQYVDFYENWNEEDTIYSPRLVDENDNKIDEITLTAVYVPNLVIDAGDGEFTDGSKTIEIKADPSQSTTGRYVYLIPEEGSPVYNEIAGVIELVSSETDRDNSQSIAGDYIDILPGETVEVVYEQQVVEDNDLVVEEDTELKDIDTDEEIEVTAFGKFIEAVKEFIVTVIKVLAILVALALLVWFMISKLLRVELKNNKSTDAYEENNFVTVQKNMLRVEGNLFVLLAKILNKDNSEVWQVVIKDETLNNRDSNEFMLVLNKSFVKKYNGQQLVVKIGESDNAKTQGFTIDEQEVEIKFTIDLQD